MQSAHMSLERSRWDGIERSLAIAVVVVWIASAVFALWNQQYVNARAPSEGWVLVLGVVTAVLMAILLPFIVGAYVAWRRHGRGRQVLAAAGAAVLVMWVTFAAYLILGLITDTERTIAYLQVEANLRMEIPLVLGVFGLEAAIVGAIGGAVSAMVRRRIERR